MEKGKRKKYRAKVIAIILAGGKGERIGRAYKQFFMIGRKPILFYSLDKFIESNSVDDIIIVVPEEKHSFTKHLVSKKNYEKKISVITGGKTRRQSSYNALKFIREHEPSCDLVIFHDGVRPLLSTEMINSVIQEAMKHDAAVLGSGILNVIAEVKNGFIKNTLPFNPKKVFNTQTPHCYKFDLILQAHESKKNEGRELDTLENIELVFNIGKKIRLIDSFYRNMKITFKQDMVPVKAILKYGENKNSFFRLS